MGLALSLTECSEDCLRVDLTLRFTLLRSLSRKC